VSESKQKKSAYQYVYPPLCILILFLLYFMLLLFLGTSCFGSSPCENGGSCYNVANYGFNCSCPAGFAGELCQIASKYTYVVGFRVDVVLVCFMIWQIKGLTPSPTIGNVANYNCSCPAVFARELCQIASKYTYMLLAAGLMLMLPESLSLCCDMKI
jgi:hypothetical protein